MHTFWIKISQCGFMAAHVADVTCTHWESPCIFTAALQLKKVVLSYTCVNLG